MMKAKPMKNLFSVYKFNSIKKMIYNRAFIIGGLMILSTIILLVRFNELNNRSDELCNYYEKVVKGEQQFSAVKIEELKTTSPVISIVFWSSLVLLSVVLLYIANQLINYIINTIKIIEQQIRYLRNGNLSERITNIKQKDEFGKICWDLNDATDQFEALVKELITSISYISQKKYFRPVLTKGLKGSFSIRLNEADTLLRKYSQTLIKEKKDIESKAAELLNAMDKFSKGDLTEKLQIDDENDLMGRLYSGFNNSVINIHQMIEHLNEAVNSTINASTQIAAAIEEMAAASEEQSRQTNDITSAVDEMLKTVSETTKNTSTAAESARNAGMLAQEGSDVVQKAVHAMGQIANIVTQASTKVVGLGKDSDKIGEIIKVIDEIADQTNLLALNAAIEAARAGEHGRGFAVVADEVRKLAERTTKSTEEIASMIQQIQTATITVVKSINEGNKEVESGIRLGESAGKAILDIVNTTNNVVDEINQVATASEEQSLTSGQIAKNIETVNNVISETLLGIQQTARAADDLNTMTANLQDLISKFKIKKNNSFRGNYSAKVNHDSHQFAEIN
ncbi:MAG: methyl-accepting chemotaxis protein [Ignavibacteriales bacterium]|nr:methyl-accepting chemotaxis protein [Ignavibacteriales bacterium]MBK7978631.1 methyl-accepting chemotaxis protein [Ignavibacteriota bacterium]